MKQIYAVLFLLTFVSTKSFAQYEVMNVTQEFGGNIETLAVHDIDLDGDNDFIARHDLSIYVSLNSGNFMFETPILVGEINSAEDLDIFFDYQVLCMDYDENGMPDIVCVYEGWVYVALQVSTLNFAPIQVAYQPVVIETWEFSAVNFAGVGDIDNDGTNELVIANHQQDEDLLWSIPDWDTFSVLEYVDGDIIGTVVPIISVQNFLYSGSQYAIRPKLRVADFDNDGLNDIQFIAQGDSEWNSIQYISSVDFGTYPEGTYPDLQNVNENTVADDVADFDNDGDLDWLVARWDGEIYVLKNDGGSVVSATSVSGWLQNFAAHIEDVNSDGWQDLIVSSAVNQEGIPFVNAETGTYVYFNDGTGNFPGLTEGPPYTTLMSTGWISASESFKADMNGDGIMDYVTFDQSSILILTGSPVETYISATVFNDTNMNGLMDTGELPMFSQQFDSNGDIMYSGSDGEFYVTATNGVHNISYISNPLWTLTTPGSYVVNVIAEVPDQNNLFFGLVANGEVYEIEANWNEETGVCSTTGWNHVTVINNGNMQAHGAIILDIDPLYTFFSSDPEPGSVTGNSISWNFPELQPNETFSILVIALRPSSDYLGQTITQVMEVNAEDETNIVVFTGISSESYLLQCSFDPNDKTTHTGWTEAGYILTNTEMEYTIRFQNTGNATATNVRLEDQLSDWLQWNTLQPIAWSHDFDLMIDETGRAIFNFENIMLPDSASDEEGSHGFVRFTIMQDGNLWPGTEIENTAEIYFDLNEPVVTNTTLNTIYSCDDLAQTSTGDLNICAGETLTAQNNAQWIENIMWYYNMDLISENSSAEIPVTENGILTMTASNSLCEFTQQWNVEAIVFEAFIVDVDWHTLTANDGVAYQWYQAGEIIPGATEQAFDFLELGDGYYSVMVTDENGCSDMSDEDFYIITAIDEYAGITFQIHPNPVADFFTIHFSSFNAEDYFMVTDAMGKIVLLEKITGKEMKVDAGNWASGVYQLRIQSTENSRAHKILKL